MPQTEKVLRRLPITIFGFLIFMLGLMAIQSQADRNRTVTINARRNHLPFKTYQRVELGENTFITGLEGRVYWKPKSFKEAFILKNIIDTKSSFNLFDIFYLLVLNCVFFWMLYDIKQENFFNNKVLKGIRIIGILVVLYGAMGIMRSAVSDYYLKDITRGQFESADSSFSLTPYLIVMFFFQAIPIFIRRAKKIQQEHEYTI